MIHQKHPLKSVVNGEGDCNPKYASNGKSDALDTAVAAPNVCGGPKRGRCSTKKKCICKEGWTGPHCLVPDGYDPINWEELKEPKITLMGPSKQLITAFMVIFSLGFIMVAYFSIKKTDEKVEYLDYSSKKGYQSISSK